MGSVAMIVLDTHIWIWWVHGDARLTEDQRKLIQENEADGLGVSIDVNILSYPHVTTLK
jgi:PIN domain nuclease of toxin-antitoxin system